MGDDIGDTPQGKAEDLKHGLLTNIRLLRFAKRRRIEQGSLGDDSEKLEGCNSVQTSTTCSPHAGRQVLKCEGSSSVLSTFGNQDQ